MLRVSQSEFDQLTGGRVLAICALGGCGNHATGDEVLVTAWNGDELEVLLCGEHPELQPHDTPRQPNPDPLYVDAPYWTGWDDGYDDGYDRGAADALPRLRVIAFAAFTGLLLGIVIAVSAAGALR